MRLEEKFRIYALTRKTGIASLHSSATLEFRSPRVMLLFALVLFAPVLFTWPPAAEALHFFQGQGGRTSNFYGGFFFTELGRRFSFGVLTAQDGSRPTFSLDATCSRHFKIDTVHYSDISSNAYLHVKGSTAPFKSEKHFSCRITAYNEKEERATAPFVANFYPKNKTCSVGEKSAIGSECVILHRSCFWSRRTIQNQHFRLISKPECALEVMQQIVPPTGCAKKILGMWTASIYDEAKKIHDIYTVEATVEGSCKDWIYGDFDQPTKTKHKHRIN